MKFQLGRLLILVALPLLTACATVPTEPTAEPTPREILCRGPVNDIPDNDPGLALFADSDESLADRKVRLAVERVNSCDPEERG